MDEILIIGHGVVGSGLESELSMLCPNVFDKYKGYNTARDIQYDIAFICVDTPLTDTCDCDIDEVRNAIQEHDAKLYVIRSTVLPGTTEMLAKETGKDITTNQIDLLYEKGIKAGALGGKLLGAGGGGFLLFYVEPDKQQNVINALNELMHVPFNFENEGTSIVYYNPIVYIPRKEIKLV